MPATDLHPCGGVTWHPSANAQMQESVQWRPALQRLPCGWGGFPSRWNQILILLQAPWGAAEHPHSKLVRAACHALLRQQHSPLPELPCQWQRHWQLACRVFVGSRARAGHHPKLQAPCCASLLPLFLPDHFDKTWPVAAMRIGCATTLPPSIQIAFCDEPLQRSAGSKGGQASFYDIVECPQNRLDLQQILAATGAQVSGKPSAIRDA